MNDFETTMTGFRNGLRTQAPSESETTAGLLDVLARVDESEPGGVKVTPGGGDRRPFEQRRWLAVAAALLLVLGSAATFVAVTRDVERGSAVSPTEPLFLLPERSGYVVSAGTVDFDPLGWGASDPSPRPRHTTLLGKPDGNGFTSLVGVTTYLGSLPVHDPNDSLLEQREIGTASGPAMVLSLRDIYRYAFQQRGSYALQVVVGGAVSDDTLIALLDATKVVDGKASFTTPPDGLDIIMSSDFDVAAARPAVGFEVTGNGIEPDDGPVTVGTLASSIAAVLGTNLVNSNLEPFQVNDTDAWLGTRSIDGENFIVWQAPTGHLVIVSGKASVEELTTLASSLQPVDEQAWRTATNAVDRVPPTDGSTPPPTAANTTASDPATSAAEPPLVATEETSPNSDAAAYCDRLSALEGDRSEDYVGSEAHLQDLDELLGLAPAQAAEPLATYRAFLTSGAVDPSIPDSQLTENWPPDVRDAIENVAQFNASFC